MDMQRKLEQIYTALTDTKVSQPALPQAGKECCVSATPWCHQSKTELEQCSPPSSSSALQDVQF